MAPVGHAAWREMRRRLLKLRDQDADSLVAVKKTVLFLEQKRGGGR